MSYTKEQIDLAAKARQAIRDEKLMVVTEQGLRPARNGLILPITSRTDHVCIVSDKVMVEDMSPIIDGEGRRIHFNSTFHDFVINP